VIEEGEAEGFINSIRFFVIYRREQLQLFLRARRSLRRELTEKEKQRRLKIVDSLSEEPTGFMLPPSFFKNAINSPRERRRGRETEEVRRVRKVRIPEYRQRDTKPVAR
jgi:hypothetical protein